MGKNFITTLGVLVALLPFVTIPSSYKIPLFVLLGSMIAYVSYKEHHQKKKVVGISKRGRRSTLGVVPMPIDNVNQGYDKGEHEQTEDNKEIR